VQHWSATHAPFPHDDASITIVVGDPARHCADVDNSLAPAAHLPHAMDAASLVVVRGVTRGHAVDAARTIVAEERARNVAPHGVERHMLDAVLVLAHEALLVPLRVRLQLQGVTEREGVVQGVSHVEHVRSVLCVDFLAVNGLLAQVYDYQQELSPAHRSWHSRH